MAFCEGQIGVNNIAKQFLLIGKFHTSNTDDGWANIFGFYY